MREADYDVPNKTVASGLILKQVSVTFASSLLLSSAEVREADYDVPNKTVASGLILKQVS